MTPLAITVDQTSRIIPFKRTKINAMIKTGELESVLVGRRRMILMRSVEKMLEIAPETASMQGGLEND